MKLFKTVVILGLAILSLSSSVAFGCDAAKITAAGVDQTKPDSSQTVAAQPASGTAAGTVDNGNN